MLYKDTAQHFLNTGRSGHLTARYILCCVTSLDWYLLLCLGVQCYIGDASFDSLTYCMLQSIAEVVIFASEKLFDVITVCAAAASGR